MGWGRFYVRPHFRSEAFLHREVRMKVGEIMRQPVVVVHDSDTLEHAAKLMLQNDLRGLPVVDEAGKICGFISVSDYVAKEKHFPFSHVAALQLFGKWVPKEGMVEIYEQARTLPVREIMNSPALTVEESGTVEELVDLMLRQGLSRIPVVRDGIPVGIVSRHDLLKLMFKIPNDGKERVEDAEKAKLSIKPPE
jgi:CBS domain-containing protein